MIRKMRSFNIAKEFITDHLEDEGYGFVVVMIKDGHRSHKFPFAHRHNRRRMAKHFIELELMVKEEHEKKDNSL